jgi:hypothetical protein
VLDGRAQAARSGWCVQGWGLAPPCPAMHVSAHTLSCKAPPPPTRHQDTLPLPTPHFAVVLKIRSACGPPSGNSQGQHTHLPRVYTAFLCVSTTSPRQRQYTQQTYISSTGQTANWLHTGLYSAHCTMHMYSSASHVHRVRDEWTEEMGPHRATNLPSSTLRRHTVHLPGGLRHMISPWDLETEVLCGPQEHAQAGAKTLQKAEKQGCRRGTRTAKGVGRHQPSTSCKAVPYHLDKAKAYPVTAEDVLVVGGSHMPQPQPLRPCTLRPCLQSSSLQREIFAANGWPDDHN